MKKVFLTIALMTVMGPSAAQMNNQSVSPALARGSMLICKEDTTETHRQVRLYGHGDYEDADIRIIERHSEDMIYQKKVFKKKSEESLLQISVSLERYSGRIYWSESNGNAYTGYCRLAAERLF